MHGRTGRRLVAGTIGLVLASFGVTACGGSDPVPPEPASVSPGASTEVLSITARGLPVGPLEPGSTVPDDSRNGLDATVVAPAEGSAPPIEVVSADVPGGTALAFGAPCAGRPCPREILEVPDDSDLDPGTADFTVSATVRLEPDQTSWGSNIVQKGFALGSGGQWKLQVDGEQGKPSCTVVAPGGGEIHVAKSDRSIADGAWHELQCRRTATSLAVVVDGVEKAVTLPSGIDLNSEDPIRIGGKHAKDGNDPFHGQLAGVTLTMG